jgi:hypothetical protein
MDFSQKASDAFLLIVCPRLGREAVLTEMTKGERTFDANLASTYVSKGVKLTDREATFLAMKALEHGATALCELVLDKAKPDLNKTVNPMDSVRYSRDVVLGDYLLKSAADSGNAAIVEKLHGLGVRADLIENRPTVDDPRNYVMRQLWHRPDNMTKMLEVLQRFYPGDVAHHIELERKSMSRNEGSVKSALVQDSPPYARS